MATFVYRTQAAIDQTGNLVTAGSGQVFAITDTAFATPLTVTDTAGVASTTVLVSGPGQTNTFLIDDHPELWWRSGAYVVHLFSVTSMVANAAASAADAQSARVAATAAQAAAEALAGSSLSWAAITGKPATFAPAPHSHSADAIADGVVAPARLGAGTPSTTTFLRGDGTWATVTGGGGSGPAAWADITGKPTTFTPSAHSHTVDQISDTSALARTFVKAADAATMRSTIGAGTSSLVLGATGSTAAAGDHTHTKASLNLANVDNTADLDKPISAAVQSALNALTGRILVNPSSTVGVPNGTLIARTA